MGHCCVITSQASAGHDCPGHPESERRLLTALAGVPPDLPFHTAGPASEEAVHRIHAPYYTTWLQQRCQAAVTPVFLDADTYITRASYDAALHAAGAAVMAIDRALDGGHAFALVRPPATMPNTTGQRDSACSTMRRSLPHTRLAAQTGSLW